MSDPIASATRESRGFHWKKFAAVVVLTIATAFVAVTIDRNADSPLGFVDLWPFLVLVIVFAVVWFIRRPVGEHHVRDRIIALVFGVLLALVLVFMSPGISWDNISNAFAASLLLVLVVATAYVAAVDWSRFERVKPAPKPKHESTTPITEILEPVGAEGALAVPVPVTRTD